jgi:two-component system chemotaxis response regulator CheB
VPAILRPSDDTRDPEEEGGVMSTAGGPAAVPPVVVVGASAGGVEALRDFVSALPPDFPACVLVVLHLPADAPSALPSILSRAGSLPARHAVDGDTLELGDVLVAPPDRHLMVIDGVVAVTRDPHENGHRPAVDVLFRSAARALGPRVVAVVLSGALDDGAAGTVAVTSRGGRVVVQDFEEALHDSMPRAAARAAGDEVIQLGAGEMGSLVAGWVQRLPTAPPDPAPTTMTREVESADLAPHAMHHPDRPGVPAGFGCPDCAGALYEIREGDLRRFRCRVGHAWSPQSLLARQTLAMESALWMALRSLEERAALNTELGRRASQLGHDRTAARFGDTASEALGAAELVRQLISDIGDVTDQKDGA